MALTRIVNFFDASNPRVQVRSPTVVDTGAGASLAQYDLFKSFKILESNDKINLTGAFGDEKTKPIGKINVSVDIDGLLTTFEIHLIKAANFKVIIGNPTIEFLKINISHKGVFTPQGRNFGQKTENAINLIKMLDNGVKVFNVDICESKTLSALRIGVGVYENCNSGRVITSGNVPEVVDDFTLMEDLPFLPQEYKENDTKKVSEIKLAFKRNSFLIDSDVSSGIREKVQDLVLRFKKCIAVDDLDMGAIPRIHAEFRQEFTEYKPSPCPLYRIAPNRRKLICNEIDKLLKLGVAKPFKTETITTSLITVKKKDGSLRVVSDLRFINSKTKPCNLRLPRLDDILEDIVGYEFYNSWDVKKGYWHLKVAKDQHSWYTFQCPECYQTYCWIYTPMGGKNSGSVFSHAVQTLIIGDLNDVCWNYIDDSYAPCNDLNKGLKTLETIFGRLVHYNMRLGLKKIRFFCKEIDAFGFHVSKKGRKPCESRVIGLRNSCTPTDKKLLLSALASMNYYRSHVVNFASLSAKLYHMTGEKTIYDQNQVNILWPKLRDAFCNVILLTKPDYSCEFIVQTDACNEGVGGVLVQIRNNERHIISCFSKKLNKAQSLWSISQQELYGIKLGLAYFEHIVMDSHIVLETDNASVYWLLKLRIGEIEISSKLPALRSLFYISTFTYTVRLVGGQSPEFLLSDLLSRKGYQIGEGSRFVLGKSSKDVLLKVRAYQNGSNEHEDVPILNISVESEKNNELESLTKRFKLGISVTNVRNMVKMAQTESAFCRSMIENPNKDFRVRENVLYRITHRGEFLVVPRFFSEKTIKMIHENDHASPRKLIYVLNEMELFVSSKYRHILNVVQQCVTCGPAKDAKKAKTDSRSVSKPLGPFDIVSIDLTAIGDIPILCLVDHFSHFVVLKALRNSSSKCVKEELISIFSTFGLPLTLLCDNAKNLNSAELNEFYSTFGINVSNSSVLNSTGNYLAEFSIKRFSVLSKTYGLEIEDLHHLNLQLMIISYKLNLEKRESRNYISAFEAMFARFTPWIFQLPDLSKTRMFTLSKGLTFLYNETLRIRNELDNLIHRKRDAIGEVVPVNHSFNIGQYVRIKNLPGKGAKKKLFRNWTENLWKITERVPYTNTVKVTEIVLDPGFQPRKRRVHVKFLKKVNNNRVEADRLDFKMLGPESGHENNLGKVPGQELPEKENFQSGSNGKSEIKRDNDVEETKAVGSDKPNVIGRKITEVENKPIVKKHLMKLRDRGRK